MDIGFINEILSMNVVMQVIIEKMSKKKKITWTGKSLEP